MKGEWFLRRDRVGEWIIETELRDWKEVILCASQAP